MKKLLAALLCTALASPLWAQLSTKQLPITKRLPDNSVVVETRTVSAALDGLLQESAVKSYHAELQALKTALNADVKTVRTRLKPIQDRLQRDRPRVQLGSFVRGLDSLLKTSLAAPTVAASSGAETGVKPIPDQPANEEAGADTAALSAPATATEETGTKVASASGGYWPWVAGLALLTALALGALYGLARREITRLKMRETFGSNEQLMAALRKQVQTQHDELRQLQDENDALRRKFMSAAATPSPVVEKIIAPELPVVPAVASVSPEPEIKPLPEPAQPEPEVEAAPFVAPEPQPEPPAEVTFFLSTPNRDGSFLDVRRLEFIPSQSLYQFRLTNAEGTEAEFVFADDPASVRQALSSPDTYLQPVCEYTDLRLDAQRIRTMRFGKARQSEPGERWELVEKAEVTFG